MSPLSEVNDIGLVPTRVIVTLTSSLSACAMTVPDTLVAVTAPLVLFSSSSPSTPSTTMSPSLVALRTSDVRTGTWMSSRTVRFGVSDPMRISLRSSSTTIPLAMLLSRRRPWRSTFDGFSSSTGTDVLDDDRLALVAADADAAGGQRDAHRPRTARIAEGHRQLVGRARGHARRGGRSWARRRGRNRARRRRLDLGQPTRDGDAQGTEQDHARGRRRT